MCPDRKFKWFADRGHDTQKIHERALARFNETYSGAASDSMQIARSQPISSFKVNLSQLHQLFIFDQQLALFRWVICGLNNTLHLQKAQSLVPRQTPSSHILAALRSLNRLLSNTEG